MKSGTVRGGRSEALSTLSAQRNIDPHRFSRQVQGELDWIVMKALEKDRTHRYESASAFAADVQRFLNDEPVEACPPSAIYRLRKFSRRNRATLVTLALIFVTTIVVPSMAAVQHQRRISRLTESAITGLADAHVSMANEKYADAQSQLTEVKTQLAGEPILLARFGPELNKALRQAEIQLRLLRFHTLAEDARLLTIPMSIARPRLDYISGGPKDVLVRHLNASRQQCRQALEQLRVLENPAWLEDLKQLSLKPADEKRIREIAAELLFLLAHIEFRLGKASGDTVAGAHRAIALLGRVETLAPNLRSLYDYRSSYWKALGDMEGVQSRDSMRNRGKARFCEYRTV